MIQTFLRPIPVFLDTEVFCRHKFNFKSASFLGLIMLAKAQMIAVYSTQITIDECKDQLAKMAKEVSSACKKTLKKASPLKFINKQLYDDFQEATEEDLLKNSWIDAFDDFIKRTGIQLIDTNNVQNSVIFEQYFESKPPFGEGKKKFEFPDAFVIEALRNFKGGQIHVVSSDDDWEKACASSGTFVFYKELPKFLDFCWDADIVKTFASRHSNELRDRIAENFQDLNFWVSDVDGEVSDVDLDPECIEIKDYFVVLKDEIGKFTLALPTSVPFSAEISYIEPGSELYDKEEWILVYCERRRETRELEICLDVELEVSLSSDTDGHFKVESVHFEKADVEVPLFETQYPYK